ncbi:MAG: SurA N-terminal domain-containing protein [Anaerolineae bacterium]|nr:SurA N-terminal domain-containing protein [Anaerolineae bacterium]
MAKRKKITPPRTLTKKQRGRAEKEARMTRWLIGSVIAVGVIVVATLAYGYIAEVIIRGREPVAFVNDRPITAGDFEARVLQRRIGLQLELDYYRIQQLNSDPTDPMLEQLNEMIRGLEFQLNPDYAVLLGQQVLDEMVQEEVIRQEAESREITVSEDEIDQMIEEQFGYDREARAEAEETETETLTETVPTVEPMTYADFQQRYEDYIDVVLKPSGLGVSGFREMMEASLLEEKVREEIIAEMDTEQDHVQFRFIAFESLEEASATLERLEGGELWEDLVAEIEADEGATAYAAEPDWQPQSIVAEQVGEELAAAIFATPVGGYVEPMMGSNGLYYLIEVTGYEEQRELDSFLLIYMQNNFYNEWLTQQVETSVEYAEDWQDKVPTTTP